MVAILIMATAGISLATDVTGHVEGDTTYTGANTFNNATIEDAGANSGEYQTGAFNFSEYSDQEVTSDISGNAVVHGDSSANVAGNQNNCFEAGSCINGDNGGVIQTLTAGSGNIVDGGNLGGHFVDLIVPVMTYEEQFIKTVDGSLVSTGFAKGQSKYTAEDASVISGEHKVG